MSDTVKQVKFDNKTNSRSYFEVVRIEELLNRTLDHDICQNHIVNFYVLFLVTEGEGIHMIDLVDYAYAEGVVLLIRKDQLQKFSKSNSVRGYLLVFTEGFVQGHLNGVEVQKTLQLFNEYLGYPKIILPSGELSVMLGLIRDLEKESQNGDEFSEGIARSILHIAITRLDRVKAADGQFCNKKKYLDEFIDFQSMVEINCFQTKKVTDYASQMAISTKKLNKVVQSIVNKPAKTFIDEITILQIKRLFFGTSLSIKEIAFQSGFDDPANFTKYFKKCVGETPEEFRRSRR